MNKPSDYQADIDAIRNMIAEAITLILKYDTPQRRGNRASELLQAALALANDLAENPPAVALGQRGGLKTAERGSDYFRKLAAKRKTHSGGRPKKDKGGA